jgi:hypothetical protein
MARPLRNTTRPLWRRDYSSVILRPCYKTRSAVAPTLIEPCPASFMTDAGAVTALGQSA